MAKLKESTIQWLANQLNICSSSGDIPIFAGHHNLLQHSPLFNFGYVIDNADSVVALMKKYNSKFFLSGHLHPQSIVEEEGTYDIAGGSFTVYPHRYGVIKLEKDRIEYISHALNTENIPDYKNLGYRFFYENAFNQVYENMSDISDTALRKEVAEFCAKANVSYFAGTPSQIKRDEFEKLKDSINGFWRPYIESMITEDDSLQMNIPLIP